MEVPHLLWNLSRDLIGPDGVLIGCLAETKVEAGKDERKGDTEPHAQQSQHGGEGNGP